MLEGSTAPHCKQVLVTGEFCAADAHTPVRSVPDKNNIEELPVPGATAGLQRNVSKKLSGSYRMTQDWLLQRQTQAKVPSESLGKVYVLDMRYAWDFATG